MVLELCVFVVPILHSAVIIDVSLCFCFVTILCVCACTLIEGVLLLAELLKREFLHCYHSSFEIDGIVMVW